MRYLGQTSFNETVIRLAWIASLDVAESDRNDLERKVVANLQAIYPGDSLSDVLEKARTSFLKLVSIYSRDRGWHPADYIGAIQEAYQRFDQNGSPKRRRSLGGSMFSRRWPLADRDAVFLVEIASYMNGVLAGKYPIRTCQAH